MSRWSGSHCGQLSVTTIVTERELGSELQRPCMQKCASKDLEFLRSQLAAAGGLSPSDNAQPPAIRMSGAFLPSPRAQPGYVIQAMVTSPKTS